MGNIMCDLDPKVKVKDKKAAICDGVPSTAVLIIIIFIIIIIILFQESTCAYAIIIMAVFWITEALPIAVTALLPVFLFPIVGLLSVKATSQQYINVSCLLPIFREETPKQLLWQTVKTQMK